MPILDQGRLGPGAAAYKLPTSIGYDTKHTADGKAVVVNRQVPLSYSFGLRVPKKYNTIGPGPIPSAAAPKAGYEAVMTKTGVPTSLKYSFGLRTVRPDRERRPGPADCQLDPAKQRDVYAAIERKHRGPQYSMARRFHERRADQIPASNAYPTPGKDGLLPNLMNVVKSKAPEYVFGIHLADLGKQRSPGPAAYHPFLRKGDKGLAVDRLDPVRQKAPQFTFGGARKLGDDRRLTPAPNNYDLRFVKGITGKDRGTAVDGRKAPSWGLGQKRLAPPMVITGDNS